MWPDLSIALRRLGRAGLILWLTLPFRFASGDDFLEQVHEALSINDSNHQLHLQLSGLIDLETYLIDQPAPGLIYTDDDVLFNPRLTLFLDAQVGSHIYVFAQARADRGFDPSDQGAQVRLDEYFVRYSFGKDVRINFQVGQFATIVERQPNGGTRAQRDDFGGLDAHVGRDELVLQITAVRQSRREAFRRRHGSLVEPTGEVVGIVGPGRHSRRRHIQQMRRVVGAIGRPGAGTPGRIDQRDLRVGLAAAQVHRSKNSRGSAPNYRDPHHCGRLSPEAAYHRVYAEVIGNAS